MIPVYRLMLLIMDCMFSLLPSMGKRWIGNRWRGWDIAPDAHIGLSLVRCNHLVMASGARIGHLNLIIRMDAITMGTAASIGARNIIRGVDNQSNQFAAEPDRRSMLTLGEHADITGTHYFDCTNHISIGAFTIIAGRQTQFFSHGISMRLNQQQSAPISIGKYCMIGAGSTLLKGAQLPDYSALAAGSTLHRAFTEPYTLYSGVPAISASQLEPSYRYFTRSTGWVD